MHPTRPPLKPPQPRPLVHTHDAQGPKHWCPVQIHQGSGAQIQAQAHGTLPSQSKLKWHPGPKPIHDWCPGFDPVQEDFIPAQQGVKQPKPKRSQCPSSTGSSIFKFYQDFSLLIPLKPCTPCPIQTCNPTLTGKGP